MSLTSLVYAIWESESAAPRVVRTMLAPTSWLFGKVTARRNARFDNATHAFGSRTRAPLPAVSIGNLTVGGTGKTPVAAWCVQQLRTRGASPAIVMRGVGDDEWRVHGLLNPGSPVVVSADRVGGMITARTRGADCVVLDDAFQHRQAPRVADIVLVSADRWRGAARLLPAGPFREPLSALRRAHAVVITVKAATDDQVTETVEAVRAAAPDVGLSIVRLAPGTLRLALSVSVPGGPSRKSGMPEPALLTHPPAWLQGRTISVTSAIGDPGAFESQLRVLGATIRQANHYADHHAFSAADAAMIANSAQGTDGVVCTLKDAVKLSAVWPREAPPLWYLSQSVVVERGAEVLDRALARVLTARASTTPTAG